MPDDLSTLIRAYVDDELSDEEAGVVQARLEEDETLRARVAFERSLRSRVGHVMHEPSSAPEGLAVRVRAAFAAEAPLETPAVPTSDRAAPGTAASSESPLRVWLAGPRRANVFAVAATLAAVAGAVLFGIFGRQIDTLRPDPTAGLVAATADWVSSEHQRCAGLRGARDSKARWMTPEQAARGLREHLGVPVGVFDLSGSGYRFVGAGPCRLPGAAVSGHLIYTRSTPGTDGCREAMLSLFIVSDSGQFDPELRIARDFRHWAKVGEPPLCRKQVAGATDGRLFYFLVCCNDPELPELARQLSRGVR